MEDPLPKKGFKSLGDSKSGPKAINQSPNYIFLGLSLSTTSLVQSFSLNKKWFKGVKSKSVHYVFYVCICGYNSLVKLSKGNKVKPNMSFI